MTSFFGSATNKVIGSSVGVLTHKLFAIPDLCFDLGSQFDIFVGVCKNMELCVRKTKFSITNVVFISIWKGIFLWWHA